MILAEDLYRMTKNASKDWEALKKRHHKSRNIDMEIAFLSPIYCIIFNRVFKNWLSVPIICKCFRSTKNSNLSRDIWLAVVAGSMHHFPT